MTEQRFRERFRDGRSDPKLPIGSKRCKCERCGRYFSAPGPFDLHWRKPKDAAPALGGGCYDPTLCGLVEIGGYWQSPPMGQDARSAFHRAVPRDDDDESDAAGVESFVARQETLP